MATVKVDISEVEALTKRAHSAFDAMPMAVFGFVEAGADVLVSTDPYQDRTGDLRDSTKAVNVNDDPDAWEFLLEMGEGYAVFVNALGFSRIDEVGEDIVPGLIESFLTNEMPGQITG